MKNQQKLRSASEIDLKSQFATFDGIATKDDNAIVKRIMPFQGFQVMLDYDLAELYGVETKQLKRQVKRNMRRFPSDFMIEISERDMKSLRCQFGTSNRGGDRYGAYAFTEQGIAMLSSILRSERAIDVNIRIMRAFVAMRRFVSDHKRTSASTRCLTPLIAATCFQAVFCLPSLNLTRCGMSRV